MSSALDEELSWFAELDAKLFDVHRRMAVAAADGLEDELLLRYRFHLAMQRLVMRVQRAYLTFQGAIAEASRTDNPSEKQVHSWFAAFGAAYDEAHACVEEADDLSFPELPNLDSEIPVADFLLEKGLVGPEALDAKRIDGAFVGGFLGNCQEMLDKGQRILRKSQAAVVSLHERIGDAHAERR